MDFHPDTRLAADHTIKKGSFRSPFNLLFAEFDTSQVAFEKRRQ